MFDTVFYHEPHEQKKNRSVRIYANLRINTNEEREGKFLTEAQGHRGMCVIREIAHNQFT